MNRLDATHTDQRMHDPRAERSAERAILDSSQQRRNPWYAAEMTDHEQPQRSNWVSHEVPVQLRIELDDSGVRAVAQEPAPAPTAPSSPRTSPVRVTVDLPPATHIALKRAGRSAALPPSRRSPQPSSAVRTVSISCSPTVRRAVEYGRPAASPKTCQV